MRLMIQAYKNIAECVKGVILSIALSSMILVVGLVTSLMTLVGADVNWSQIKFAVIDA